MAKRTNTVYGLRSRITGRLVKTSVDHAEVRAFRKMFRWSYRKQLEPVYKDPGTNLWLPLSEIRETVQ